MEEMEVRRQSRSKARLAKPNEKHWSHHAGKRGDAGCRHCCWSLLVARAFSTDSMPRLVIVNREVQVEGAGESDDGR